MTGVVIKCGSPIACTNLGVMYAAGFLWFSLQDVLFDSGASGFEGYWCRVEGCEHSGCRMN